MDALGARPSRRGDDPADVQIALARRRRPDRMRLVCLADMEGARIGLGIDCDRPQPKAFRGPDDAAGDLAAIGDQN